MWQEANSIDDLNDLLVQNNSHKIKPALIESVEKKSIGEELGFEAGDSILTINGKKPRDLIDYQILINEEILELKVIDKEEKVHIITIEKDQDTNLGINFKDSLFDSLKQCNNKCPFCFIDQQPPGKRKTLYLKDDDYRLSFLYGSYLTLTNLNEVDWNRILIQKLSPLYISVHSTNANIRERLLKNKKARDIVNQIKWFENNNLQIHAQIVVCPEINDGKILEESIYNLSKFHSKYKQTVISVAVVPVGLTKFRPKDDELVPIKKEFAQKVILQIEKIQNELKSKIGSRFCWLADEWYLIAGYDLPKYITYEDMPQESNGVGTIREFLKELNQETNSLPNKISSPKTVSWVVGKLVYEALLPICKKLNRIQGLTVYLYGLPSIYWGQEQVVTGLLTCEDLIHGLEQQELGESLYLPSVMLKMNTDLFLDDKTIGYVEKKLKTNIHVVENANDIINNLIDSSSSKKIGNHA